MRIAVYGTLRRCLYGTLSSVGDYVEAAPNLGGAAAEYAERVLGGILAQKRASQSAEEFLRNYAAMNPKGVIVLEDGEEPKPGFDDRDMEEDRASNDRGTDTPLKMPVPQ